MGFRIGHRDPVLFDHAVGRDQSGRTNRSFDGFALSVLSRPPGAVRLHDLELRIGQQGERQVKLGDKLMMRFETVSAHPQDHGVGLGHRLDSVAEPARFLGSARGIVFGIEPQDYMLARVVRQRMGFAVAAGQAKSRRPLTFKTCHRTTSVKLSRSPHL